jgi:hypothetical protein
LKLFLSVLFFERTSESRYGQMGIANFLLASPSGYTSKAYLRIADEGYGDKERLPGFYAAHLCPTSMLRIDAGGSSIRSNGAKAIR